MWIIKCNADHVTMYMYYVDHVTMQIMYNTCNHTSMLLGKHNTLAWLHDQHNSCKGVADHVLIQLCYVQGYDHIANGYVINVMYLHR